MRCLYCSKECREGNSNRKKKYCSKKCIALNWREKNKEKYEKIKKNFKIRNPNYDKNYNLMNKEKRKEQKKVYREVMKKDKNWKERRKEETKRHNIKNPEKVKARRIALKIEIPIGQICLKCNKNVAREKHHPDYSKPSEIIFLCISCHKEIHSGVN